VIRFLLDDEEITLGDDAAPDLTVLDWLRLHKQRTGTKEGCGSGDCGACTVVVAEPANDADLESSNALVYKAINSCITFVGALHGKQLLTVESLADGKRLHPVQAAMVGEHGSQCGFCTPGFVMSLYALYQDANAPLIDARHTFANDVQAKANTSKDVSDWHAEVGNVNLDALSHRIDRTLGGNLCRCTGYRPIKRAAVVALAAKQRAVSEHDARWQADIASQQATARNLNAIAAKAADTAHYKQPQTIEQFADYYAANPNAHILAGGTDLALEVTQNLKTLKPIISTLAVAELLDVEYHGDEWRVGAAVSLNRCLELFRESVPTAETLLLRFGSDQVRNQGTIGGNIASASPIGDLPPLFLALDARVQLQQGSTTREIALSDFFTGYRQTALKTGEFIRGFAIPKPLPTNPFAIYKVSKRMEDDISSVCAAFHLMLDGNVIRDTRVAFGGMAATPIRVAAVECLLQGAQFDQETMLSAQSMIRDTLTPIDDVRASAEYRKRVAANLFKRFWLEYGAREDAVQVGDVAALASSELRGDSV